MNRDAQDNQPKDTAGTGGKKVFREPQLKVYARVAELTQSALNKVKPKDAMFPTSAKTNV